MTTDERTEVRKMAFDMFDEATATGQTMTGLDAAAVAEAAFHMAMRMVYKKESAKQAREHLADNPA
jgi:hypothetical protein